MSQSDILQITNRKPVPADLNLRLRDEKLEALKAVVGKLAHDFNNFLVPQFGYATLLKDEIPSGSPAIQYADALESAARKSEAYLSSILLGMRPERHYSQSEIDFTALVRECLASWAAENTNRTDIRLLSEIDPSKLMGDERQWRSALKHLLSNARYALAMGGTLEVTLKRDILSSGEVQRLGLKTNTVSCLRVRDTGFGMSPEVAKRAFEPFFTTRGQVKAAGLGLTIVHSVTLHHGGQVELQSAEDQGTAITLWLPVSSTPELELDTPAIPLRFKTRKKVLLIEDDPLMKEVLRTWLTRHEFETETAANEDEVRKVLQRAQGGWSLVISEADLQSGRGEDLYRKFSESNPGLCWLFLSGQRTPEFGQHPSRQEPLVMKKPVSLNALSEVILKYTNR